MENEYGMVDLMTIIYHIHTGVWFQQLLLSFDAVFGIVSTSGQSMLDHLTIDDPSTIISNTHSSDDLNHPQRDNKKDSKFQKEKI